MVKSGVPLLNVAEIFKNHDILQHYNRTITSNYRKNKAML